MILSEKEMGKIMRRYLRAAAWATPVTGIPDAAHAIAKKLAEGVVVEARGVIRTTHEGHYALTIEHTYQGSGIGWATNAGSDVLDILRGDDDYESVTVTAVSYTHLTLPTTPYV